MLELETVHQVGIVCMQLSRHMQCALGLCSQSIAHHSYGALYAYIDSRYLRRKCGSRATIASIFQMAMSLRKKAKSARIP
jgi:hypothetical protein